MSSRRWYLLSGLALLIGGLLAFVFNPIHFKIVMADGSKIYIAYPGPSLLSPLWLFSNFMLVLGSMLIAFGLYTAYGRLANGTRGLRLVGLILTLSAIFMTGVLGTTLHTLGIPFLDVDPPGLLMGQGTPALDLLFIVDSLLFSVGTISLGLVSMRMDPRVGFVYVGVLFILAGLFNIVHLVPIPYSLWSLYLTVSMLEVYAFVFGLLACGVVLVTLSKASPVVIGPLLYGTLNTIVIAGYILVVGSIGVLVQQTRVALILSLVLIGLIAILFQPLHNRLQRAVSRLVYGERDNPYAVLSQLGKHMEATPVPKSVLPTIVETIARSLKLPYAAIALKHEDELTVEAAYGTPMEQEQRRFPLVYHGEQLGELILSSRSPGEPLTPADQRLLQNIAPQIGVAVHAVRLTVDLQRSRERLVTAREEERRRLRRDLHDGLGPQLASQALILTAARKLLLEDLHAADALLADATVHVQEAITDIRRLVYDLRPPALDDLGLVPALHEQIAQYQASGILFRLDAPEHLPALAAAVEVACYRITQEALTNVVRHAHARTCSIRIALDTDLTMEIADDGMGLAPTYKPGVGFSSMRERAEELGGSCRIESKPTGGTCVSAHIPL
jgi:signal transduction histidine kinase